MFAKSVIGSGRFLRMPPTSRLLYYDLGMAADDDGIVEAFSVMRTTGATEDDLRVLASKGFVSVLNDDLVTYIADWSRNNLIKKDRYHPSTYRELLVQITNGTHIEPRWNPHGTQVEPEVRLGKDRIGKVIEETWRMRCRPRFRVVSPIKLKRWRQENHVAAKKEICGRLPRQGRKSFAAGSTYRRMEIWRCVQIMRGNMPQRIATAIW